MELATEAFECAPLIGTRAQPPSRDGGQVAYDADALCIAFDGGEDCGGSDIGLEIGRDPLRLGQRLWTALGALSIAIGVTAWNCTNRAERMIGRSPLKPRAPRVRPSDRMART